MLIPNVKKRIKEWTTLPFDADTINEIKKLKETGCFEELNERFYKYLDFGTGGIRGVIGAGTNRMNIYTVGMVTQGIANYIISEKIKLNGIVIVRDSRIMSYEFAKEAASIFAGNNFNVYFFEDIIPVSIVSFAVRKLNTVCGVAVTASHNPSEYNGYKLYWNDGAQIISPLDKKISKEINKITKITKINFDKGIKKGLIKLIGEEIVREYICMLEKKILFSQKTDNLKIVYTPLHGAGYKIIPRVLNKFGFNKIFINEEQAIPDGNFPTTNNPNPEEKEAMISSIKIAEKLKADLIIATDPDADRMRAGYKSKNGEYKLLNGNQIAVLFCYYLLLRMKDQNMLSNDSYIIKTIITTDLLFDIVKDFNCRIFETLIGFKWIASKIKFLEQNTKFKFIFGCEEGYGYLINDFCRDKDGISASYFFAELTDWLYSRNLTIDDLLNEIYIKYGLYHEEVVSFSLKGINGKKIIDEIMHFFRTNPPDFLNNKKIISIYDYKRLEIINKLTNKSNQINNFPSADIIQFYLDDGSKITIRPSGTEPKIKLYLAVKKRIKKNDLEIQKNKIIEKSSILKKALIEKINILLD